LLRYFDRNAVAKFNPVTGEQEYVGVNFIAQDLERVIFVDNVLYTFLGIFSVFECIVRNTGRKLGEFM